MEHWGRQCNVQSTINVGKWTNYLLKDQSEDPYDPVIGADYRFVCASRLNGEWANLDPHTLAVFGSGKKPNNFAVFFEFLTQNPTASFDEAIGSVEPSSKIQFFVKYREFYNYFQFANNSELERNWTPLPILGLPSGVLRLYTYFNKFVAAWKLNSRYQPTLKQNLVVIEGPAGMFKSSWVFHVNKTGMPIAQIEPTPAFLFNGLIPGYDGPFLHIEGFNGTQLTWTQFERLIDSTPGSTVNAKNGSFFIRRRYGIIITTNTSPKLWWTIPQATGNPNEPEARKDLLSPEERGAFNSRLFLGIHLDTPLIGFTNPNLDENMEDNAQFAHNDFI